MSTDSKKRKRRFPRIERIKIVEYGLIALVVLAFIGLAIWYGTRKPGSDGSPAPSPSDSPTPTADSSIRGMNVWNALLDAGFHIPEPENGLYDVKSPEGASFVMQMRSDDKGILLLSFETVLSEDLSEDTEYARVLNQQNRNTLDAIRSLFDCVMPVFKRPRSDSDMIAKQCEKTVKSGETYSKNLSGYTVRISSDPESVSQTVTIELIRNAK